MKFNKDYTNYWDSAVNKSVDGTVIAGINEAKYFLQYLKLNNEDKILDLGCSVGRMYAALSEFSTDIYGVDPDPHAVQRASSFAYRNILVGTAEATGFDSKEFDLIFCWAVYDVVNHLRGLREMNRILKISGKLLLTGKNDNYFADDLLAFKAEKNAFLKSFPNKFTNLQNVLCGLTALGFKLDRLFMFRRRGDIGALKFVEQDIDKITDYVGYEYLLICHKISDESCDNSDDLRFDSPFSRTATKLAFRAGFSSPKDFFESIGHD